MSEAIILNQAKRKMIELRNSGEAGWKITQFAVGDGGTYTPDATQTTLKNELIRKDIESSTKDGDTYRYEMRLTESECVGKKITEFGLIDTDGMLLCIKSFPAKIKDSDIEMEFKIDDTF